MTRREPRYVSRYFIKMMLSYCLVIIIGLGLVSAFTTSWVVGTLTEKESRIDREIVRQVQTYSDARYRTVQSIFSAVHAAELLWQRPHHGLPQSPQDSVPG